MNSGLSLRSTTVLVLTVAAALSRLLPHPPNFTPLGALALFSGAYMSDKRLAFVIPIAALVLSDAIIGFHLLLPAVYGCFAIMVWIGFGLRNRVRVLGLSARVLAGSILFFVVTNFGVWVVGSSYPHTPAGLLTCFIAAIPFFHNTVLGDLTFAALLFGSFVLAERVFPALRRVPAAVPAMPE